MSLFSNIGDAVNTLLGKKKKSDSKTAPKTDSQSGKIDTTGWSPEQIIEWELAQEGVPKIQDNSVKVMLVVALMLLMLIGGLFLIKKGRAAK